MHGILEIIRGIFGLMHGILEIIRGIFGLMHGILEIIRGIFGLIHGIPWNYPWNPYCIRGKLLSCIIYSYSHVRVDSLVQFLSVHGLVMYGTFVREPLHRNIRGVCFIRYSSICLRGWQEVTPLVTAFKNKLNLNLILFLSV